MNQAGKSVAFFTVIIIFYSLSCRQPETLDKQAERVADLECRAITLREQRFALANDIRFAQDTLLHLKENADSTHLSQKLIVLTEEKNRILQSSLQLADSIHQVLDSARKYTFKTANDRKFFDKKIKELLLKNNCKTE